MTREQERHLTHDLSIVIERHGWLTPDDWMRACERAKNGYLVDAESQGHELTDAATQRAAERLAATLTAGGLFGPLAFASGTR